MELLRMVSAGPCGSHPVVDALKSESGTTVGLSGETPPSGGTRVAQSRSEPSYRCHPSRSA
jgi:hypothetical protein